LIPSWQQMRNDAIWTFVSAWLKPALSPDISRDETTQLV